jgi:O-antigen/teichoic acid export membrane protein
MSLTREQFIKNSAWTFIELALYPVLMIIATPVFINHLGIEQYGLWMLINTITLGMNALNIGVGDTNIRLIAGHRVSDDFSSIKKVFHYNFSLSGFLFLIAMAIGTIFWYFDFIAIFYKRPDVDFASNILLLASCSAGLKFIEVAVLSVFKAFERFDINSKLVLISKNSVMAVNVLLVILGYNLQQIFISTVALNFVNIAVQLVVLHLYRPGILSFPSMVFLRERLLHLNYRLWYWLQSVISLLGFLADKLLIAIVADVTTLGYYSIASLVAIQIHNFFLSFGSFVFPRVAYRIAAKRSIEPLYYIARSLVALPGWTIITLLLIFGDFIFKAWLGEETFNNSIFFIKMYLVFEAAMLLIIVPFYFINGSRLVKLNSVFEIVIRSSHLISMCIGFYLVGINGILYGLIISSLINIPFQYYYFHREILSERQSMQFIFVILPVMFMFGFIFSGGLIFNISLFLCLLISCKIIYFDRTWQYSAGYLPTRIFSKY